MKKTIPIIYFIVGVTFVLKGLYAVFNEQEIYYLIFSLETKSKITFIIFNIFFGLLILFSGVSRLRRTRNQ